MGGLWLTWLDCIRLFQAPVQRVAEPSPAPAPKQPLPAEHQQLQDVLSKLVTQCLSNARNPVSVVLRNILTFVDVCYTNTY